MFQLQKSRDVQQGDRINMNRKVIRLSIWKEAFATYLKIYLTSTLYGSEWLNPHTQTSLFITVENLPGTHWIGVSWSRLEPPE
jgi:hypothetical protein